VSWGGLGGSEGDGRCSREALLRKPGTYENMDLSMESWFLKLPEAQDGVSEGLAEEQFGLVGPLSEILGQCLGNLRAKMGIRLPRWREDRVYDGVLGLRGRITCQLLSEPGLGEG
jgi:hypothetical protein